MAEYADAGHRPHARHIGETPRNEWVRGPLDITVTLDAWGPQENLFTTIYDALQSNWGDAPNRSSTQECQFPDRDNRNAFHYVSMEHNTDWCRLTKPQQDYVESCFAGKTLPQILELLSFEFTIDGCTRACTHQLVRTRIGAAFMQHGGRDNDWRHRKWTMPETIYRACEADEKEDKPGREQWMKNADLGDGRKHCISNWEPIEKYLSIVQDNAGGDGPRGGWTLRAAIEDYLQQGRDLYAALVDAGIPWQDARRVLWMGTQTYIHACYNYLALQGVCNKRLEPAMDWEINAVAQLIVREVRMKCPPVIGKYLQSLSDKIGKDAYAGLESWTPSGKYTLPDAAKELPRAHVPEQAPFWILHPDSMAGGPVQWIPTNGEWPEELKVKA